MTLEDELKVLIVRELNLADVQPEQIDTSAPLFGAGLGLDSIDALELAVAIQRAYGVQLEPADPEQRGVLESLGSLANFIAKARSAKTP
ncbi:MAG TPA: phosphopantetheine-binding protein [Polyangiaceae bacterium]|jgi:acyl carrier protein|nr:phosphopantetheine-binding protein [Polyangiaceae bacterium]